VLAKGCLQQGAAGAGHADHEERSHDPASANASALGASLDAMNVSVTRTMVMPDQDRTWIRNPTGGQVEGWCMSGSRRGNPCDHHAVDDCAIRSSQRLRSVAVHP
jgi:hypothetical protein